MSQARARYQQAFRLLAARRYAEAWPLYEARRETFGLPDPIAGYPEWTGQPLPGKHLMLVIEQGLGDQIMFARWVPMLEAMGVKVTIACDPRTSARLFERCGFGTAPWWKRSQPLRDADYWCFLGSIPHRLGNVGPCEAVYIPCVPGGSGTGVMAQGNPAYIYDETRSLAPDEAAKLLKSGTNLAQSATGARDLLETAQIIEGLAHIISVDTSIAHLALSMGKPTTVLLPTSKLDWRWNDGVRSDWYPQARLEQARENQTPALPEHRGAR